MKHIIGLFLLLGMSRIGYAQLEKGTWMGGGMIRFEKQKFENDFKSSLLDMSLKFGFFPVDKFAVGLTPSVLYTKQKSGSYLSRSTTWLVGPFARYYFLESTKNFNLLSEASFQIGKSSTRNLSNTSHTNQNRFFLGGGFVVFANTTVGFEILSGYEQTNYQGGTQDKSSSWVTSLGIIVHLQPE